MGKFKCLVDEKVGEIRERRASVHRRSATFAMQWKMGYKGSLRIEDGKRLHELK